jgi:hypothetical protein
MLGAKKNACTGKHLFDNTKSSSYKKDGQTFEIQYGTGSCSGYLGQDNVCMGDMCINNGFGVATQLASFFADQPMDGILGLGFQTLAVDNVMPPVQNMIEQKKIGQSALHRLDDRYSRRERDRRFDHVGRLR